MANELKRSKRIKTKSASVEKINPENLKILKKYKMDMEIRELSKTTIYNYERDLIHWMSYLCENQFNSSVKDVDEDDIEEFIYYCKSEGNNTERIKRRMSSISALYKFLRRKKEVKENPMEFVARPKKGLPVVVQTYLTPKQVGDIREWLEEKDDILLKTYVELSLSTMARVTAISNITWEQVDYDMMVIADVLEKEGKIVDLYFDERTRDLLVELKEFRDRCGADTPYVFATKRMGQWDRAVTTTLANWCRTVGNAIGVETLHPHDWRHSSATLKKNAGMDLETVSTLLNHEGTDVTRKFYLKEDKSKLGAESRKYSV